MYAYALRECVYLVCVFGMCVVCMGEQRLFAEHHRHYNRKKDRIKKNINCIQFGIKDVKCKWLLFSWHLSMANNHKWPKLIAIAFCVNVSLWCLLGAQLAIHSVGAH